MKKLLSALLLSVFALSVTAFAAPSFDLIVRDEQPGWLLGEFYKEKDTGKIYKTVAVERIETDAEIIYQPYVSCFESGELATAADCGTETAAELMGK